ncbi:MAG TPA: MBL fold metallo-hydrolase [Steroidobacteraceae bacterium]|nr:MBL fold metallo-hydrolase [Steroidobacteraceae bacterium]
MAVEHVRHWRIGDVEIARIVEINAFEDDMKMLLQEGTPQFVQQYEWLRPNFATAAGRMLISFQCFVLRSRDKRVMIDTCIGADRKREYDVFCNLKSTFLEDLKAAGYPRESIDTVLCTHLHFDHVGWNTHLVNGRWVPTFPNASYLLGREEFEHWQFLERTHGYHDFTHIEDSIKPILDAKLARFVEKDHRITDEVWLEPTPGHTPGHVSVHISSRGQEAVITGDMMHHPIQLAVPDSHANFDMDKAVGARTRRAFIERYQDRKALIIGSHFCEPTSGWIVRDGAAWRLALE